MRIQKLKQNDRIEILWHDAHECGDEGKAWQSREDDVINPIAYKCLSLGYFIKRTEDMIYIAGDMSGTEISRTFGIPIGCIKAVKKL